MSQFDSKTTEDGGFLAGKLQPPPRPSQHLSRKHLLESLTHSTASLLLLIAPSGYGKTLLLQEALGTTDMAWFNLDAKDQQPSRFASYLIAALRQLEATTNDLGRLCLNQLEQLSDPSTDLEDWLLPLLHELHEQLTEPCWLVIDNLHWLTNPKSRQLLLTLLHHRPQTLRLACAGQQQPDWDLKTLQLQDQLLLLTQEDLVFTPQEAYHLLIQLDPELSWQDMASRYQSSAGCAAHLKLGPPDLPRDLTQQPCRLYQLPVYPHPEQPLSRQLTAEQEHFASLPRSAIQDTLISLHQLTWMQCLLGQPQAARAYNREAWEVAAQTTEASAAAHKVWLEMDRAFIEIHKGELVRAQQRLSQSKLARPSGLPAEQALHALLQAQIQVYQMAWPQCEDSLTQALLLSGHPNTEVFLQTLLLKAEAACLQQQTQTAFTLLDEAEQCLFRNQLTDESGWQAAITLLKTQLWMQTGKSELALTWLAQLSQRFPGQHPAQRPLHLVRAQSLLLSHRPRPALQLLESLPPAPENYPAAPGNLRHQVLLAQALAANRQHSLALEHLYAALVAAEPQQFRLAFRMDTPGLEPLLTTLKASLAPGSDLLHFANSLKDQPADPTRPPTALLTQQLSNREQEVLRLVAEGLSNQEIGERLFISLHTVKSHLKHLMKKLEVRSRTQAVTRARELRLL